MKYVFIAHSHTLCLCCIGTIQYLKLNLEDCIILTFRNFECDYIPNECVVVDCNVFYENCKSAYFEISHRKRKELIREIDFQIDIFIREEYQLFLPHMCDSYAMLLATNKKCKKVSFVQEAAFTVAKRFETNLSVFTKIKYLFKSLVVYHTPRFYGRNWYVDGQLPNKNIDTYGLYSEYFNHIDSSFHKIEWPSVELDFSINDKCVYFIMDGYVRNRMAESDIYLKHCKDMILQFHGNKNAVKFHPNQSPEECNKILSFFSFCNAEVQVLDSMVPFEFLIAGSKRLRIIGMTSSLLFLAKKQGHYVTSCDNWMMESPLFRQLHDDGMPLFHEYFSDEQPVIKANEKG